MAGETDVLEVVQEPTADRFEATVPDDIASIFTQTKRTPEPESKPAAPAPVAAVEPAPAPIKKMSAARQAAVERARKIEEVRTRLNTRARATEAVVPVLERPARQKEVLGKFKETAEAGDLEAAGNILLQEAENRGREYAQIALAAAEDARIQKMEKRAQEKHPDWDQKLRAAGIFDGCRKLGLNQDGSVRYANQEMGEAIYSEDNPPMAAYEMADLILKVRAGESLEDEIVDQIQAPAKVAPVQAAPAPAPAPAPVVQTRDELSAAVEAAAARPKGISQLANAGTPRMSFSLEDLDHMMETQPAAYLRLMDENKDLSRWHMAGR